MTEEREEYKVSGRVEVRRETRLPYSDPSYRPPTTAEIAEVIRRLELTGREVAQLVGAESSSDTGSRTVRRWLGGEREMPYAVWRLLLIEAKLELEGVAPSARLERKVAEPRGTLEDVRDRSSSRSPRR